MQLLAEYQLEEQLMFMADISKPLEKTLELLPLLPMDYMLMEPLEQILIIVRSL